MNHNIIKTDNYLLIVDDSEIKVGDWVMLIDKSGIAKVTKFNNGCIKAISLKQIEFAIGYYQLNEWEKIIAHLPLNNSFTLKGLDLLPPLEREDDVEKLSQEWFLINQYNQQDMIHSHRIAEYITTKNLWKQGYNKAKEKYFKPIPEWVYTRLCSYDNMNPNYLPYDEDDITKKPIDCSCDNCFYGRTKMAEFILSIQSLPQPKMPTHFECQYIPIVPHQYTLEDHLDVEPKTTTNSQGQIVWVGKYIY